VSFFIAANAGAPLDWTGCTPKAASHHGSEAWTQRAGGKPRHNQYDIGECSGKRKWSMIPQAWLPRQIGSRDFRSCAWMGEGCTVDLVDSKMQMAILANWSSASHFAINLLGISDFKGSP